MSDDMKKQALEPLESAPPKVKAIIKCVLKMEKEKIYEKKPHLNSDIIRLIKEVVQ